MKKMISLCVVLLSITQIFGQEKEFKIDMEIIKKKYPEFKKAKELVEEKSFPTKEQEEKGIYIYQARSMALDSKKNIYVVDDKGAKILKFDLNGSYLKTIGRRGQGPGEFAMPANIFIDSADHIIVSDIMGRSIKYFDEDGKYLKEVKTFKSYNSFVALDDGKLFAVRNGKVNGNKFIEILSENGEVLKETGSIQMDGDNLIDSQSKVLFKSHDEIYLTFQYLSTIQKYSSGGELLSEIKIHSKASLDNEAYNLKTNERKRRSAAINSVFHNDKLYVLRGSPVYNIVEISSSGDVLEAFYYKNTSPIIWFDFVMLGEGDQLNIYVLQVYPESCVRVFKIK